MLLENECKMYLVGSMGLVTWVGLLCGWYLCILHMNKCTHNITTNECENQANTCNGSTLQTPYKYVKQMSDMLRYKHKFTWNPYEITKFFDNYLLIIFDDLRFSYFIKISGNTCNYRYRSLSYNLHMNNLSNRNSYRIIPI